MINVSDNFKYLLKSLMTFPEEIIRIIHEYSLLNSNEQEKNKDEINLLFYKTLFVKDLNECYAKRIKQEALLKGKFHLRQ